MAGGQGYNFGTPFHWRSCTEVGNAHFLKSPSSTANGFGSTIDRWLLSFVRRTTADRAGSCVANQESTRRSTSPIRIVSLLSSATMVVVFQKNVEGRVSWQIDRHNPRGTPSFSQANCTR